MTDEFNFFNDLRNEREMNDALMEVEKAVSRFEAIMGRHVDNLASFQTLSTRKTSLNRTVERGLASALRLFSGPERENRVKLPSVSTSNRFSSSPGQLWASLASSLSRFSSRNL